MAEFSTPSSVSQEQFSVPVQRLEMGAQPALNGLADAFSRGILSVTDLVKAGGVQDQMDTQLAENAAKRSQAAADVQIQPKVTEVKVASLQKQLDDLKTQAHLQESTDKIAEMDAKDWAEIANLAETTGDKSLLDDSRAYFKHFGTLPRNDRGSILFKDIKRVVSGLSVGPETAGMKEAQKQVIERGGSYFRPDGTRMTEAETLNYLKTLDPALDSAGVDKALGSMRQMQLAIPDLTNAGKIVNDAVTTPVGPGITEGSHINQVWNKLKAFVGNEAGVRKTQQQNELNMILAKNIQNTIKQLAGSGNRVMAAEIDPNTGLFTRAQPTLTSTPAVWNKWIADQQTLFSRAHEESRMSLPESIRASHPSILPGTLANGLPDASQLQPAPQKREPTPAEKARALKVSTQRDINSAPSGSWMIDPKGNYQWKP